MADPTFNEQLLDAMLAHQIGLQQLGGNIRNQVWALLDATEADLKRQIRSASRIGLDTPARVRALDDMLARLKKSRLKGWKGARQVWFDEMNDLAKAEPGFFDRVIKGSFNAVELATVLPEAENLRRIVTSQPFMGKTVKGWADNVQRADLSRIEDQIKIGLTQGESLPQISRRVVGTVGQRGRDGVTQITRRNAEAITRTITNGVSSEARAQYAQLNKDLAPQEVFTATLDSRTTPICMSLDGTVYLVGEGPTLPLHFGERSLYSPVVDGQVIGERPMRPFTEQSLVREFSKKNDLGKITGSSRANLPRGTKREFDAFASKRMRELTGRVPAKTTYTEFLRRRPAAIQDDILGPTRGKLFRDGGLGLDKFVMRDGTEITLKQLASRNAAAFERAGLDPAAFK